MKRFGRSRARALSSVIIILLVVSVIGCAQPVPTPTPTAVPKAAPTKEAKPEAKESKPEAKEAKPAVKQAEPPKEAKKEDQKLVKLKMGWSAVSGAQAPVWMTKEKGLFQKYGFDAELVYIATATTQTQALLSGDIQIAQTGGGPVVSADLAGADLVMIAMNSPVIGYTFFGAPNLQRIEDLRGKTVGITRFGSNTDFAARYTLKRFGLEPEKDVAIVQLGGTPETMAGLLSGAVQATVTGPPNSVTLKKAGMRELVNIADLRIPYPTSSIAVSKKYLANNQETVSNFLKAFLEAIAAAKKDKEFTMKVIGEYSKTDDKDVLDDTYEFFVTKILPRVPYASPEAVQTLLEEMAPTEPKVKGVKPDTFIDNTLLKQIDDSGFVKKLYGE